VCTDSTKYTSRVSRRDDPPLPIDRTAAAALYIDSLLYYTFGVPSRNNDDDDDSNNNNNNHNNRKLLSSGAIDCGHGRLEPRIWYTDDNATTCVPGGGEAVAIIFYEIQYFFVVQRVLRTYGPTHFHKEIKEISLDKYFRRLHCKKTIILCDHVTCIATGNRLLRTRTSRIRCIVPRFHRIIFSSLLSEKPYIVIKYLILVPTYSQYSIRETNLFIFL